MTYVCREPGLQPVTGEGLSGASTIREGMLKGSTSQPMAFGVVDMK